MSTPSQPLVAAPIGRPWQTAYLRFRELERRFTDEDASGRSLLALLNAAARGRHDFDRKLKEYRVVCRGNPGKLPEPPDDLVTELRVIADLRSSYECVPGYVFEDVYHLAFDRLWCWRGYGRPIPPASRCSVLYRGQRKDWEHWGVEAKIYRGLPKGPGREAALRSGAIIACQLGHAIAARLGLSFTDAMAVAQHYSEDEILGAPTWLVDFSRDPWVALFFASERGEPKDRGIVHEISPKEWTGLAAGEGNPIGGLQLVVPPGIQRIENQAGVFLIAGLPQIFDQYVAAHSRFYQHTGVLFEDPVLGITEHSVYPSNDPLQEVLAKVREAVVACECGPDVRTCDVRPAVFHDPLDPTTYEALLTAWLNNRQAKRAATLEPPVVREALAVLACFHARLQSPDYAGRLPDITSRSLKRLRHAFDTFRRQWGPEPISIRDAIVDSYVKQVALQGDHVAALMEALDEIAP